MEKLASNKFVYIILAAIIIIAVSILMLSGDKEEKNIYNIENTENLTEVQMQSIKEQYELKENKAEFEKLYKDIEQAVATKFLDGTITSDEQLNLEIDKVNKMFNSSDWDYLELIYPSFWLGTWSLDSKGKLYFTFKDSKLKPDWVEEIEIKEYVK